MLPSTRIITCGVQRFVLCVPSEWYRHAPRYKLLPSYCDQEAGDTVEAKHIQSPGVSKASKRTSKLPAFFEGWLFGTTNAEPEVALESSRLRVSEPVRQRSVALSKVGKRSSISSSAASSSGGEDDREILSAQEAHEFECMIVCSSLV